MGIILHGYRYSVYLRIARMTFLEKDVPVGHAEIDPFANDVPASYLEMNPFGRVPTLVDGDFVLYETTAIARYADEAFDGPPLQPRDPRRRARMNQIVAILDSYGYQPMVRQVFSQRVFNARLGRPPDEAVVERAMATSNLVLRALEKLCSGNGDLVDENITLADLHLAGMMAYFTAAEEGAAALRNYTGLSRWWDKMRGRDALAASDPGLPDA
ncbi:MAG: glutathione S-transferase family protein [Hyphomicrobiales bacterium]|nr:glutathione S-transferase family protein [Hyphomicrobiales bacterium]